jgi:hypothetical protein
MKVGMIQLSPRDLAEADEKANGLEGGEKASLLYGVLAPNPFRQAIVAAS